MMAASATSRSTPRFASSSCSRRRENACDETFDRTNARAYAASSSNPAAVRRSIAAVLQDNASEQFLSVRDNFLVYARLHGQPIKATDPRLAAVVERFGLKDVLSEKAADLSIGMRRRVQVAKVFLIDSPILFLDEATTGMDPLVKRDVIERIREVAREGRTVLLTTQNMDEAERLCDEILIVARGRAVARGDVETVDGHIAAYGLASPNGSGIATPGFVDLQVNGFAGIDFLDADADGYKRASQGLLETGVTAFLATFITAPEDHLLAALQNVPRHFDGARVLGVHLEGPFLAPERLGIHPPSSRRDPDAALIARGYAYLTKSVRNFWKLQRHNHGLCISSLTRRDVHLLL